MSYSGRCSECLVPYQGEPPARCECGAILNPGLQIDATPDYVPTPADDTILVIDGARKAKIAEALGAAREAYGAAKVDAALKGMLDGAHGLIATIDKQTHDEWKRHDWDPPSDCEFLVTFTAKELILLDKIIDAYIRAAGKGRAVLDAARSAPTDCMKAGK